MTAAQKWREYESKVVSARDGGVAVPRERVTQERTFKVEYAKSGRSICILCDGRISEGSVRVATEEWEPAGTFTFTKWRHLACFNRPKDLPGTEELRGFELLAPKDQLRVAKRLGEAFEEEVEEVAAPPPSLTAASLSNSNSNALSPISSNDSLSVPVTSSSSVPRSFRDTVRELHKESEATLGQSAEVGGYGAVISKSDPYTQNGAVSSLKEEAINKDKKAEAAYGYVREKKAQLARRREEKEESDSEEIVYEVSEGSDDLLEDKVQVNKEDNYNHYNKEVDEDEESDEDEDEEGLSLEDSSDLDEGSDEDSDHPDFTYVPRGSRTRNPSSKRRPQERRINDGEEDSDQDEEEEEEQPYGRATLARRDLKRRPSTQRSHALLAQRRTPHSTPTLRGLPPRDPNAPLRFPSLGDSLLSPSPLSASLIAQSVVSHRGSLTPLALGFSFGERSVTPLRCLALLPVAHPLPDPTALRAASEDERSAVAHVSALLASLRSLSSSHANSNNAIELWRSVASTLGELVQHTQTEVLQTTAT